MVALIEVVGNSVVSISSIEIIRINDGEWPTYNMPCCSNCMCCAPWFFATIWDAEAFWEIVEFLKCVFDFDLAFESGSYALSKCLGEVLTDDEDDFLNPALMASYTE